MATAYRIRAPGSRTAPRATSRRHSGRGATAAGEPAWTSRATRPTANTAAWPARRGPRALRLSVSHRGPRPWCLAVQAPVVRPAQSASIKLACREAAAVSPRETNAPTDWAILASAALEPAPRRTRIPTTAGRAAWAAMEAYASTGPVPPAPRAAFQRAARERPASSALAPGQSAQQARAFAQPRTVKAASAAQAGLASLLPISPATPKTAATAV
jgi:hypothetical protein